MLTNQVSNDSAPPTEPAPQVFEKKKEKKKEKPAKEKKKEKKPFEKVKEPAQSFNNPGSEKGQPKQFSEPKKPKFEHAASENKPHGESIPKQPKAKKPKKSKDGKIVVSEPSQEMETKVEAVDEHADLVQSTNAILNGMCAILKQSFPPNLIKCRFQGTFGNSAPNFRGKQSSACIKDTRLGAPASIPEYRG